MINAHTVELAYQLAKQLGNRKLVVAPGSPLALMVAASTPELLFPLRTAANTFTPAEVEVATNRVSATGEKLHTKRSQGVVATVAKGLDDQLAFIAGPVQDCYKSLLEACKSIQITNSILDLGDYRIITRSMPAILMEASIHEDVMNGNVAKIAPGYVFTNENPLVGACDSLADFREFMDKHFFTGSEELDTSLRELMNNYGGEGAAFNFFANTFSGVENSAPRIDVSTRDIAEFENIFAYLVAKSIYKEGAVKGVSVGGLAIRNTYGDLTNVMRALLKQRLIFYINAASSGLVIGGVSREARTVEVYAGPYDKYIKAGGNNSAILGYAIERPLDVLPNVAGLIANQDRLVASWNTYIAMNTQAAESAAHVYVQQALLTTVDAWLETQKALYMPSVLDAGGITASPAQWVNHPKIQEIRIAAGNYIRGLDREEIYHISDIVERIVFSFIFSFSSAGFFADTNRVNKKNHPDFTVEQIRLMSTLEYLAQFVMAQVTLR